MEEFKQRSEISTLVQDGETVEYSAHTIPEGGIKSLSRLYGDGILVVGDAAGFALNMGIIVRGMDLAIASGVMAVEAIKAAKGQGDYSARTLASYETMLNRSFVMKDLRTFRDVWKVLNNPRLFKKYPGAISALLTELMFIDSDPKAKLSSTALKHIRKQFLNLSTLKDAASLLRV
jgi:electron transfer flavoprotein-quinone oxidoreductase